MGSQIQNWDRTKSNSYSSESSSQMSIKKQLQTPFSQFPWFHETLFSIKRLPHIICRQQGPLRLLPGSVDQRSAFWYVMVHFFGFCIKRSTTKNATYCRIAWSCVYIMHILHIKYTIYIYTIYIYIYIYIITYNYIYIHISYYRNIFWGYLLAHLHHSQPRFYQDGLTGSAWGDWSLYTDSPLRAAAPDFSKERNVGVAKYGSHIINNS